MLTSNRMQPDVMMAKTITDGKRVWDKVHYSVYCDGAYKKLPRHLVTKHAEELLVAQALSYPKCSQSWKIKWQEITSKGDFALNANVNKTGTGTLIVKTNDQ